MEDNKLKETTQAATPQPQENPTAVSTPAPESDNKMVWWLAGGLVVIILVVGGIYWYLSKQQSAVVPSQTGSSQTPVPQVQENLENDINAVDAEAPVESDFSSVDQDLQSL